MPDSSNTTITTGLLVLAVVSIATVAFVRRSRLGSKYISPSKPEYDSTAVEKGASSTCTQQQRGMPSTGAQQEHASNTSNGRTLSRPDVRARDDVAVRTVSGTDAQGSFAAAAVVVRQHDEEEEKDKEQEHEAEAKLHPFLTASPRCWQNPQVLGFNKLRARTTLGAFSSVDQARWVGATVVLYQITSRTSTVT